MTWRRSIGAAAVAVAITSGGCSIVSASADHRGDDRIRSTARGVFAAMGLSDRIVEYAYDVTVHDTGCAQELGISRDDAWWARRSYAVGLAPHETVETARRLDPAALYGRALAHLRDAGWHVQEFEPQFGGAPAFNARRDDEQLLYFGADTTFAVTVGPCAKTFTGLSAPQYRPVAEAHFTVPRPPAPPVRTPSPGAS